jgi:hypothetical protein
MTMNSEAEIAAREQALAENKRDFARAQQEPQSDAEAMP